jgi:1-deoxy-D-xylulose-5-phosphate synthase
MMKNLTDYNFPADLKTMSLRDMELLSGQIREFLIEKVSKTGGHLASNLGVVELSVALHRVFDSPGDKIIWDVGHQSYVHKILTGRAGAFDSLRREGGISGFPKREESPHDAFNSGHSSNSISAAMGYAEAREIRKEDYAVVAVIGDGALTGGQSYEGLNNAGSRSTRLIVVLNDNEMSISRNTGGITQHLSKLRTSRRYLDLKRFLKRRLKSIPVVGESVYRGVQHIRNTLKFMTIHSGAIFEELGFKYFGPVDGHKLADLTEALAAARRVVDHPVLVHVVTKKGKGYQNAEDDPGRFHGLGPFDALTGDALPVLKGKTHTEFFGETLLELADRDGRVVALTAAMTDGAGLADFAARYPDRFFDAGIAEAHAVSFAAGLACKGLKPYVSIYSTFLQRAYDQVLEDVCMQKLPVVFCLDRAGNVGADGETHHGIYDLSYLCHMPNMTVAAPSCGEELAKMLEFSVNFEGPMAIRYPKDGCAGLGAGGEIVSGKSRRLRDGAGLDIWAVGRMTGTALAACGILEKRGMRPGLVDVRFVKPFDGDALLDAALKYGYIVTLEDNVEAGGFGSAAAAFLQQNGAGGARVKIIAWPDRFLEHGSVADLEAKYHMDAESVADTLAAFFDELERTA